LKPINLDTGVFDQLALLLQQLNKRLSAVLNILVVALALENILKPVDSLLDNRRSQLLSRLFRLLNNLLFELFLSFHFNIKLLVHEGVLMQLFTEHLLSHCLNHWRDLILLHHALALPSWLFRCCRRHRINR
jgi:hypothetical protein